LRITAEHSTRVANYLEDILRKKPGSFSKDQILAAAINKQFKCKKGGNEWITPPQVARLKRSARLLKTRIDIGINAPPRSRRRWTQAELVIALEVISGAAGSSFSGRIESSRRRLLQLLPQRTSENLAAKLMLLHGQGKIVVRQGVFTFSADGETQTARPTGTGQIWRQPDMLEILLRHSILLGTAHPQGIAEAISEELDISVTAQQVAAALQSSRFRIFRDSEEQRRRE